MPAIVLMLSLLLGADAKIVAPDTASSGVPVLVDARDSVGTLEWETDDPDLVIFPAFRGGRQAYVQRLKPGIGRFWVKATDKAGTSIFREAIPFGPNDRRPAPPPQPQPRPPAPDTGLPDGQFAIAQPCYQQAMQVSAPTAKQRQQEAQQLTQALMSLRERFRAGEIDVNSPAAIISAIRSATSTLPRDVQQRWNSWGAWWGRSLQGHYNANRLPSATEWCAVIDETATGLKAVK